MRTGTYGLLTALGIAATAAVAYTAGCASSITDAEPATTTTNAGGGGAGGATGGQGGEAGQGGLPDGGSGGCLPVDGQVMAMDEMFLGDTDWTHQVSVNAWQQFGYDLDGLTTEGGDLTDHCQPFAGAQPSSLDDGLDGIDNAWGRSVMPILASLAPNMSTELNNAIAMGTFTLLLLFEQLGSEPDQDPLVTRLYGGSPLGSVPLWDGSDCWSVVQEQLDDPDDITTASTIFADGALVDDLWSTDSTGTLVLPMNFGIAVAEVTIHHARLQMQMAPSHHGGALGLIGGVVNTEDFVEVMRQVFGTFDPSLCSGPTFESIADQVRQASDIMSDGTQDPGATCDAISVGLGFTMLHAGLGGIADPAPDPTNPCD